MTNIEAALNKRKTEGNYREIKPKSGLIDFCSNDYLGLASDPELQSNIKRRLAAKHLRSGAGAARLISGNSEELEELESKISNFHKAEDALVFSNGYLANIALFSCIAGRNDTIFYDELCHASIKDGIRLGFARAYPFKHNDLGNLEEKLKHSKGDVYVAVEALYSMDGDFAPLNEICALCERYSLNLIVDEAHTNGIFGKNGEGLVHELGLEKKVFARIITFGKALGVQGAALAGSAEMKQFLINYSRPFIYSTAISPYLVLLIEEAYKILPDSLEKRKELFGNIAIYKEKVKSGKINNGPVQAIYVKGNKEAKEKAVALQKGGFDVRAVLSPTVKKGSERLRICLHSFNNEEEILKLAGILNE
jgi:8-amino-7-oxononanoate synthase